MITFQISTGKLYADTDTLEGVFIGTAYAGNGNGLNNPLATSERGRGPLPVGFYGIGQPVDRPNSVGAFALPLTPEPGNEMFGRSAFYIHGDNGQMNQSASDGCIVTMRSVRELIAAGHTRLQVVA